MNLTLTDGTYVELTLFHSEDGSIVYRLFWGADEYTEFYQTLSLALARVATLSYCVEQDRMFAHEPLRFSSHTITYLNGETNGWNDK
jgi:hypothetical protein